MWFVNLVAIHLILVLTHQKQDCSLLWWCSTWNVVKITITKITLDNLVAIHLKLVLTHQIQDCSLLWWYSTWNVVKMTLTKLENVTRPLQTKSGILKPIFRQCYKYFQQTNMYQCQSSQLCDFEIVTKNNLEF